MKTLPGYGMLLCAASEDVPSLVPNLLYLLHGLDSPFRSIPQGSLNGARRLVLLSNIE